MSQKIFTHGTREWVIEKESVKRKNSSKHILFDSCRPSKRLQKILEINRKIVGQGWIAKNQYWYSFWKDLKWK